jgi:hypothetical protein
MSASERRSGTRRTKDLAVSIAMEATRIDGETINISPRGVLLRGSGRIAVLLQHERTKYRGAIVRAHPLADGSIAYAFKLDAPSAHFVPDGDDATG